jgi:hypothetical protein
MAIVHEGWQKEGRRIQLKEKKHYLLTTSQVSLSSS